MFLVVVVAVSHFIDEETVNRVELDVMSNRIRSEWELPQDFQVIETRNKEISMILNELEELAWRSSGSFN